MSRTKRLILVAITLAALTVGTAAPALADKDGRPHPASCGYGANPVTNGSAQPFPGSAKTDPPIGCRGRG